MSFVLAAPDALLTAASDLAGIGSTLRTANAQAAIPTTGVLAAAGDEVSTQIAALFSQHANGYQQLSAEVAAFHEKFVQALSGGANTYAAAESSAAGTLMNALNAPARALLGGAAAPAAGASVPGALSTVANRVLGGASGLLGGGGLLGAPTGGLGALTAASSALRLGGLTNAAAIPAANALAPIATAIENLYNSVEPYVAYGFNLASYVVGFLPYVGILAPQINFFYYLFEPIVQSGLFNTLDFLSGVVSFSQGLSNFWVATTSSINQFITNEINWFLSFLPPLPPLPPII
jgi:PE family